MTELEPRRERHCGAHCPDDICRGTQTCMLDGQPIGEECPICREEVIAEYGEECACEREEW